MKNDDYARSLKPSKYHDNWRHLIIIHYISIVLSLLRLAMCGMENVQQFIKTRTISVKGHAMECLMLTDHVNRTNE